MSRLPIENDFSFKPSNDFFTLATYSKLTGKNSLNYFYRLSEMWPSSNSEKSILMLNSVLYRSPISTFSYCECSLNASL